ncbi:MAG: HU family DNA-binding protein [Methylococcales bacterium]|jgi:DNA-binding protein HU-beta|nr:HU family DNA-binding protein [Methylococcales bacterium]MBT7409214.1 HU family DNA-binding protein [Methylococcales bacterium]
MNKTELIDSVSTKADITKKDAAIAVDSFLSSITNELKDGGNTTIIGFGTFLVRDRAERKGRNPRTNEEITIKAARTPAFKAGKNLKDTVNI